MITGKNQQPVSGGDEKEINIMNKRGIKFKRDEVLAFFLVNE